MSRAFVNHPKKFFSRSRANFSHITLPSFPFLSPYLPLRAIAPGLRKPPQKNFFALTREPQPYHSSFISLPVPLPSPPSNCHQTLVIAILRLRTRKVLRSIKPSGSGGYQLRLSVFLHTLINIYIYMDENFSCWPWRHNLKIRIAPLNEVIGV